MVGIQNTIYIDVCIFIALALIPVICLKIWCTLYKNIQGMIAALEDPSWLIVFHYLRIAKTWNVRPIRLIGQAECLQQGLARERLHQYFDLAWDE